MTANNKAILPFLAAAAFLFSCQLPASAQALNFDLDRVQAADLARRPAVVPAPAPSADPDLDITHLYNSIFLTGPGLRSRELAELRGLKVLFVSGFMTERLLPAAPAGEKALPKPPKYFEEHLALLRKLGVDYGVAPLNTEAPVKVNAGRIAALVSASSKPVLLITHSKGGIDALEALLAYPETLAKTRAVIALMSPFYGAPIADKVLASPVLSYSSARLLRLMGGTREALIDLSAAERARYQAAKAGDINRLVKQVPFVSVAASKSDESWSFDTLMEPSRDYMLSLGMPNDGLVPTASAILPGTPYVILDGLDHLSTVMNIPRPGYDRPRFLETVLTLALRQP